MPDDYLNRPPPSRTPPPHSHKNSIFWQFLQACKPGDGEYGDLIRTLRDRRDMRRHYAHKTAVHDYLLKCKIPTAIIGRNVQHMYSTYNRFFQQTKHTHDGTMVESVPPSIMARSGVTRKQIAIAILTGIGSFSHPAQQLKEGGKWAESAYGAADEVIALFHMRVNGQSPRTNKSTEELANEHEAVDGFKMGDI